MKKIFFSVILVLTSFVSFSQDKIDLTLRWNNTNSRYEIYARPNFSATDYIIGSSQITIITPASVPNNLFTNTIGGFSQSDIFFAPLGDPTHDYRTVLTQGLAKMNFIANQEFLLYSFVFSDGLCKDDIRLLNNNSDPSFNGDGSLGNSIDNRNNIAIVYPVFGEYYGTNYNNTGTVCSGVSNCIKAPEIFLIREWKP